MATGSIGRADAAIIPVYRPVWQPCSNGNTGNAPGVDCICARKTWQSWTTVSPQYGGDGITTSIGNSFTVIAMTKRRHKTVHFLPEVLMTAVRLTEEPDEANVSRPVLKPSDGGDPVA
jgi:hypothetical protein